MQNSINTNSLENITAFHKVNDNLITSGFPKDDEYAKAKAAGVEVVVNLIHPLNPEPQPNLAAIYNAGLIYFSLPYDPDNSIIAMEAFIALMNKLKDKNVYVHCSHNWRASFMLDAYYQITTGKINEHAMLEGIDIPWIMAEFPRPSKFVTDVENHYNIKINRI